MAIEDDETLRLFIEESQEHLTDIEGDLLEIESNGADMDVDLVNKVFRAVHSIKGGAGFFGLERMKELGHDMENVLNMIRNQKLVPTLDIVNVLLDGADLLNEMVNDAAHSNNVDISEPLAKLQAIVKGEHGDALGAGALKDANEKAEETEGIGEKEETEALEAGADKALSAVPKGENQSLHFPFPIDAGAVLAALEDYAYFYRVEYFASDIEGKGRTPRELLQDLQQTGVVLGMRVNLDSDEMPDDNGPYELLFATVLEPHFAASLLDVADEQIRQVTPQDLGIQEASDEVVEESVAPNVSSHVETEGDLASVSETVIGDLSLREEGQGQDDVSVLHAQKQTVSPAESSLRVHVKLLDSLMNLAGELVLTRNQMMQIIASKETASLDQASQRLDLITSELQEAIMTTRMQPIGVVFSKFRRIVRDLSRNLKKNIHLVLEGEDVELDKTIIEALSDPLTHLVRNGVDHGIETVEERQQTNKPEQATLQLCAYHEAGQVVIEIVDDGRGIDPEKVKAKALDMGLHNKQILDAMSDKDLVRLIFAPGFSTAQEVTDISGRGVGMDVVHTNLTHLGGVIDIESQLGMGTTVRIKLPLTLAIIPSLLVAIEEDRYAIPQVNVSELVRVSPAQIKERIQTIGGAWVLRLRGDLLPLVQLRALINRDALIRAVTDPLDETAFTDKTKPQTALGHKSEAMSIVVVTAGTFQYGLVVDHLLESEEIVVKPLDRYLNDCQIYAGATILGDGRVAMILDVVEMGRKMELSEMDALREELAQRENERIKTENKSDVQSLVLVKNSAKEQFAIPLSLVSRIERIEKTQIEKVGGRRTIKYRGGSLVLFAIEDAIDVKPREDLDRLFVVVFSVGKREVGLLVSQIVDTVDILVTVDQVSFRRPGVLGSAILNGETTLLIDLFGIVSRVEPDWVTQTSKDDVVNNANTTILIVEDSNFFLNQMVHCITEAGYQILTAEDGQVALEVLKQHGEDVDLILTDIEMPNMDGLTLTRRVRSQEQFAHLPIVAVTSLAGEAAKRRGRDAGVDAYLIKLDQEQILNTVAHYLKQNRT